MDGSAKAAKIIGCWIMEREVGDEFEVNDVVLRVVEASNRFSCDGCYFLECDVGDILKFDGNLEDKDEG